MSGVKTGWEMRWWSRKLKVATHCQRASNADRTARMAKMIIAATLVDGAKGFDKCDFGPKMAVFAKTELTLATALA